MPTYNDIVVEKYYLFTKDSTSRQSVFFDNGTKQRMSLFIISKVGFGLIEDKGH